MILFLLATVAADPSTLPAVLARAKGGDVIALQSGNYGKIAIRNRSFSPPLRISANGARLTLEIIKSSGVEVAGAEFGPAMEHPGYAALIRNSSNIRISNSNFTESQRGVVIDRSQRIKLDKLNFVGLITDGIDIALSQFVRISDVACTGFTPGKAHADCIQGWSRPGGITSDVIIERATSHGPIQGIGFFNHVRKGVDDGGYDRIQVLDSRITSSVPQGIALYACRDCQVIGNRVKTLKPSKYRARINIANGSVLERNNVVED